MEFNGPRALASELYLIHKWNEHSGPPTQRRNEIFQEFVKLGMRERWRWHALAAKYDFGDFTAEEKEIVQCRFWRARSIADTIGHDLSRVVVTNRANPMKWSDLRRRVELDDDLLYVCEYDGSPFDVLPELAYSMTAFDDPDDVEECRRSSPRDQSLWVSGVFCIMDKIVWVSESGNTIREKFCDPQELKEAIEAFERYKPFESTWWTEATKVGEYAEDDWCSVL